MHPIEDTVVVDPSQALIGPLATQILGDLGAEVIKVERPEHGDLTRNFATEYHGLSAYFSSLNRNKRSITLDLTSDEGKRVLKDLASDADIFVQNFGPGNAERFGATYEMISNVNDSIIYCNLSGYGDESPYSDRKLFDIIAQGQSGLMGVTGTEDGEPVRIGVSLGDISGAFTATYAILAALYHRSKTGDGEYIDISLLDTSFSLLLYHVTNYFATGETPEPMGTKHPNLVPYQAFETDDSYLVVGVVSESLWPKFCRAIDREDLIDDERFATFSDRVANRRKLDDLLDNLFARLPTKKWVTLLEEAGVPCTPVNDLEDIIKDPHIRARNMIDEVEHSDHGTFKLPGVPVKFANADADVRMPPPNLGEHTEEVLRELDYSTAEIDHLRRTNVI